MKRPLARHLCTLMCITSHHDRSGITRVVACVSSGRQLRATWRVCLTIPLNCFGVRRGNRDGLAEFPRANDSHFLTSSWRYFRLLEASPTKNAKRVQVQAREALDFTRRFSLDR
jgi:hypothetical protein